ncbi:hypothetical protein ACFL6R_07230 [Gemmatimonadota bacterium]
MSTKTRLGIMMFLQYAIWGAWAPVLSTHLNALGFTGGPSAPDHAPPAAGHDHCAHLRGTDR